MLMELTSHVSIEAAADYCAPFVDAACDAKRTSYVPDSHQTTHSLTYSQAASYVASGYPFVTVTNYALLYASAQAYYGTSTPAEADVATYADALKSQGDAYYATILPAIERVRGRIIDLYTRSTIVDVLNETSAALFDLTQPPLD